MKKLNRLFAILIAVFGVSTAAKADTSILKESEGWQKITSMPSSLGDYYFALVDKSNDLMLTMAPGAHQGSGYYTMYYRKSVNPLQHRASLWTIEGTNYTFRNVEYTKFAMQTEWGAAWNYRTHDQPNPCEWTATKPIYSLDEVCWTIQNGKYPEAGYLGPWDNTVQEGAEVACNKTGDAIGKYHIYAIKKSYCKDIAANATQANPVDMSALITNSDAALAVIGMGGWTIANTITRNNNSGYDGKSGFFEFCNWGGSSWEGSMSQTISSLPNGKYKVRATGQASATDVVLTLTANGVSTNLNCIGDKNGNISADGSVVASGSGVAGWQYMEVECVVANGELIISAYSKGSAQYRWANIDNFSIYYCGKDLTSSIAILENAISRAQSIDQARLIAGIITKLNNEIANAKAELENANKTANSLEQRLEALNAAIDEANNWIAEYNSAKASLVAALERFEKDFNDGANGAMHFTPVENWSRMINAVIDAAKAKDNTYDHSSFAEATTELHAAMDAVYASYVKYGMLIDHTSLIGNADCTDNTAWEGTGRTTTTSQHWSGSARTYFTQNHEGGAARTQTITLPKSGSYILKVSVRAVEAASYAEILINGVSYKTSGAHGRTGGTIATDGSEWESIDTGIKAGKTFANGNKGFGWVYNYIYFKAEAGEATIAINLSNVNSSREANCGGMELYYLRPNYVVEENNVVRHYGIYDEAIATTHTTHDVTNATLTNKAIGVANNLNALIIAKSGQVSNQSNVIIGSTVASLALTDGYAFNAHDNFTATKLSYGRQLTKDTWLTICLPFDYTIPEGVKVETLTEIDTNTKIFTFDEITEGKMKANTPYIIKNSTNTAALFASLSSIGIEATPKVMKVSVNGVDAEFLGTYAPKNSTELMEGSTYDILFFGADGQLYYLSSGITTKEVTINPFRAYIRLPKNIINWNNGQQARVRHRSSEMTDIDTAESADDSQKTTVIYDMHGRRVTEIVKGGMYIVNGRKVVVK